jgi:K+-transporting ATPase ATPase B chain
MTHKPPSLFDWNIAGPAMGDAFKKLDPRLMIKNPVMFVTMVGAALTTVGIFTSSTDRGFIAQLAIWLWFTVLFANFAEAVAEGRGKAQAKALRSTRVKTVAHRLAKNGQVEEVNANDLRKGDVVAARAGEIIPADGDVIEGAATVDESAIPRRSSAKVAATAAPSPAAPACSRTKSKSASPSIRAKGSSTA